MSAEAVLKALAEPSRQEILRLVRVTPRSVGEIAEQVDITQQAVSQHLQVLKDAGLVAVRQDGTRRLYQTRPEGLESLDQTPGGQFTLDLNGVPVRGRYLAVDRPRRLLLSWGTPALSGCHRAPPPWRSPSPPTTAAPP